MVTINLSDGKEIHSQRNNKLIPDASCGPTSVANAILSAEIPFDYPKTLQLEDYITAKLMSKESLAHLQKIDPGAKYNPWNSSVCIVWAVNLLAGKTITEVQEIPLKQIVFNLVIKKQPMVVGGAFTKSRHFVCTVGVQTEQDNIKSITSPEQVELDKIKNMIIDDSWGNYMKGYKDQQGNDTYVPISIYKAIAMDGQKEKRVQIYYHKGIKG